MKKTLVSALTTALVVGAASTTFAAANPFSDVPADHWAYDAVVQLAQDGIINGYAADGTFKGDQSMTRYEMAQIVAKAMAKAPVATNNDKALIDKLSAEFSDELANLGVRVSELESKVDNVKWTGNVAYMYKVRHVEGSDSDSRFQKVRFRLTPTMKVNDQWTAHARMEYYMSTNTAHNGMNGSWGGAYNESTSRVDRAYVDGQVGDATVTLGRFGVWDAASHGLAMDDAITGAQISIPVGHGTNFSVAGGRYSWSPSDYKGAMDKVDDGYATGTWTYLGAEIAHSNDKWDAGVGYRQFRGQKATDDQVNYTHSDGWESQDAIKMINAGVGYHFTDALYFTADGSYVHDWWNSDDKTSYNFQLNYQATDKVGVYVAYKKLSMPGTIAATYDLQSYNKDGQKGWEIGTNISLAKNVSACAYYFNGKGYKYNETKQNMFYGHINFAF